MIRTSIRAMGTEVILVAPTIEKIAGATALFEQLERRFSRFDPDSELSHMNRRPAGVVDISSELRLIFRKAEELREATGGLVDPAIGGSVTDWGYDRTFDDIGHIVRAPESRDVARWSLTARGIERGPGVSFDLGGIAKGWACDRAVESGLVVLASAGGDMRSTSPDTIAEVMDTARNSIAARISVEIGALATSSVAQRTWQVEGETVHHIIDPRTGRPATTPIVSATVTARTAADAEAGAKAVLMHGEHGLAWCDQQSWLQGAVVLWATGAVYATGSMELAA